MNNISNKLKLYWNSIMEGHLKDCKQCNKGFGYCEVAKALYKHLLREPSVK